jgi:hypothetical protein
MPYLPLRCLLQKEQLELAKLLVMKGACTADERGCVYAAVKMGWIALLQACLGESVKGA